MSNTVIGQQTKEVQALCEQFIQSYNKHRKTVAEWGRILQTIRDSNLKLVDADGKPLATTDRNGDLVDVHGNTFSAICRELGLPRSTAYHYISLYLVNKTYPVWLQEAATASNVNLGARHVQNKFEEIRNLPDYPGRDSNGNERTPNSFEIDGIVTQLKAAKAPTPDSEPLTEDELKKQMQRLMNRAKKAGIALQSVQTTLEQALAAAFGCTRTTREKAPIYSHE